MHSVIAIELERLEEEKAEVLAFEQKIIDGEKAAEAAGCEWQMEIIGGTLYVELQVESFKEVLPTLRHFRASGHRLLGDYDDFDAKRKWWRFTGNVVIDATLKSSAICKRVKVGTREVPVYKWDCTDSDVAEEVTNGS